MTNFLIFVTLFFNIDSLSKDETLMNNAIDAFYKKKFDYSIKLFKELGHKTDDVNTKIFIESCLGHIYAKEKLDIHQGIYHFRKGESIISESGTPFNKNHIRVYNFLGTSYEKIGLIDSAEYYFKKGTRLYKKHKSKIFINNSIINNHALLFIRKQEYNLAKDIFDYFNLNTSNNDYTHLSNYLMINIRLGNESEIFSIYQLLNNYPHKNEGLHFYRLGNYYIKKKDYSKAIPLLLQFIKTYEDYFKDPGDFFYSQDEILLRNFYKARVHLKLAECYKETKQEALRLQHLEHGIHYYHQGKSLPNFTIHIIGSSLFRALEEYYQEQGLRQHHFLDSAQYILDKKNKTFNYKNEPLKYEAILLHHFKGHYALEIQEKEKHYWKSYTLFKSFIGNQLKDEDQLMHFKEMKAIQNEWIDFFSTHYQNTQGLEYLTKTLEIVENLKSNILNKRSSNIFNPNFEEYIQQEIAFDTIDRLKQLSPLLDQETMDQYFEKYYEDKIFISYHLTNNILLIISYNNGEYTLEKKKIGVSETEILSDLEYDFEKSNYFISRDFIKKLNIVGNHILPELLEHTEKKRIIISTGQALSFIPFEILRYNNRYLIEDFAVSYSFSLHYEYKDAIKRKTIVNDKITTFGIAPFASSNLSYSKLEVKNICDDFLINDEANYNTTYQKIKQDHFKTLHFATHTHIDNIPQKSFIKLSPNTGMSDKITFDDIQKLHLSNLELVTLSTCQSANGRYADGEGSLSLQRAFAYAQIPSIIAGKWNVNDQASSTIMKQFYVYLKEGWDKDIALKKAKLDLLGEKEYLYNNPMFWGSLILTGNTNPITFPSLKVQFLKMLLMY